MALFKFLKTLDKETNTANKIIKITELHCSEKSQLQEWKKSLSKLIIDKRK